MSSFRHSLSPRVLFAVSASALLLAACKDDSAGPVKIVTENVVVPVNSSVVAAAAGTTFNFPNGGAALSPAVAGQNLAIQLGGTAAAPAANLAITSPAGTLVGSFRANLTFGSCIFTITQSSFTSPHPLSVGQVITVNPCSLTLQTAGQQVTGGTQSTPATLTLGTATSAPAPVGASVDGSGNVTINGKPVGTVDVTPSTGTGSTG